MVVLYLLETCLAGAWSIRNRRALAARGGVVEHRTEASAQLLLVSYLVGLVLVETLLPSRPAPASAGACLLLFACGQLLGAWAAWTLGDRWCRAIVTLPGSQRVTGGPYRFLRHPIYAATAAEWFALPGIGGHFWYGALAALAAVFVLARRARVEDELLGGP